jgi:hypothetical protein
MKNRPLTISLLIAVVAIWAWIMYSVFDYMESPDVVATKKKSFVSRIKEDTSTTDYMLALNYKDPFLKKEYVTYKDVAKTYTNDNATAIQVHAAPKQKVNKKPVKEEIPLPAINYVGRIQNAKMNKPVAILLIDDKEYMMQEGEIKDGVLLKGIANDSVKVVFSKKIFYVKKQ